MIVPAKAKRLRSPIQWFGGKGNMTAKLLPLLPEHQTYVEAFGGGASLLFAKEPSPVEVYNDVDEGLVGFFRVLRDPRQLGRLKRLADLTPYSRSEYDLSKRTWRDETDPALRAYRWFVVARMSFGGKFGDSWGSVVTSSNRGMADTAARWLGACAALPAIQERLLRVQVECQDWRTILRRYDRPETLFYLDPPYPSSTRRSGGYAHELSEADHAELVDRVLTLKGKVLLSGYRTPIYRPLALAR